MIKVRKSLLISLFCCFSLLCSLAVISFIENTKLLKANAVYSEDIVMVNGASIRLDSNRNGIRFATFIPNDIIDSDYFSKYEIGTIFIPKMYMGEGEELVLNKKYQGKSTAVAVFNGDKSRLITEEKNFPGGKLFNTVLELTSHTNKAVALNGAMVARTYIKDLSDQSVTYLNAVERAPAFVAVKELASGSENDTLYSYAKHIFGDSINVCAGQSVKPTLVVDGLEDISVIASNIPLAESLVSGLANDDILGEEGAGNLELATTDGDKIYGELEGFTTVDLSVLDGKISKTVPLTVCNPQVVFYSSGYTPTGDLTIPIKNLAKLEIESKPSGDGGIVPKIPLVKTTIDKSLYKQSNDIITISKADLLSSNLTVQGDYLITATTEQKNVLSLPIYVRNAVEVDFEDDGEDVIGNLIFLEGHFVNLNPSQAKRVWSGTDESSNGWGYYYDIPKIANEGYGSFSINTEYVRALSASNSALYVKYVWTLSGNTERNIECSYNKEISSGKWVTATTKVTREGAKYISLASDSISQLSPNDYNFEIKFPLSCSASALRFYRIYLGE